MCQFGHQRSAAVAGTNPAAVQQDVGLLSQLLTPAVQSLGKIRNIRAAQRRAAQCQLAGAAVGQDLHRVHLAKLLQHGGNLGDTVLISVDDQRLHTLGHLRRQGLEILDAAIDHQQMAGRRGRPWRGHGFGLHLAVIVGLRGTAVLGLVISPMVSRSHRRAIKQNALFERQRLALGLQGLEQTGGWLGHWRTSLMTTRSRRPTAGGYQQRPQDHFTGAHESFLYRPAKTMRKGSKPQDRAVLRRMSGIRKHRGVKRSVA